MKYEEIQKLWDKHCKIDNSELGNESLKIPEIHNTFSKILVEEKLALRKLQSEYNKLSKLKWEYYLGKLDTEEVDSLGWERRDLAVLRADVDKYLEADDDLIQFSLKIELANTKVEYLESILKTINGRGYQIKNAVDFLRFINGS